MTTLAQASLTLQTARSLPPRFAPGLSTAHGGIATGDPGVSPDRTHTGRPSRTCRSYVMWFSFSSWRQSSPGAPVQGDRHGDELGRGPASERLIAEKGVAHARAGRQPLPHDGVLRGAAVDEDARHDFDHGGSAGPKRSGARRRAS